MQKSFGFTVHSNSRRRIVILNTELSIADTQKHRCLSAVRVSYDYHLVLLIESLLRLEDIGDSIVVGASTFSGVELLVY